MAIPKEKYFELKLYVTTELEISESELSEIIYSALLDKVKSLDMTIEDEEIIHQLEPGEIGIA